jgi:hypothetical protein
MSLRKQALGILSVAGLLLAETCDAQPAEAGEASVSIPAAELQFYRNKDGLTFADAWGNPADGPHSNFIKLPANTVSPPHIHTASYYGVVIVGIVTNERVGAVHARNLSAGSYWYQRGGEPHVTSCISPTECVIFVTSHGSFDFIPAGPGH